MRCGVPAFDDRHGQLAVLCPRAPNPARRLRSALRTAHDGLLMILAIVGAARRSVDRSGLAIQRARARSPDRHRPHRIDGGHEPPPPSRGPGVRIEAVKSPHGCPRTSDAIVRGALLSSGRLGRPRRSRGGPRMSPRHVAAGTAARTRGRSMTSKHERNANDGRFLDCLGSGQPWLAQVAGWALFSLSPVRREDGPLRRGATVRDRPAARADRPRARDTLRPSRPLDHHARPSTCPASTG